MGKEEGREMSRVRGEEGCVGYREARPGILQRTRTGHGLRGGSSIHQLFRRQSPALPARGMEGDSRNLGMRRMRGGSVSATNLDVLQNHQRPVHTRNRAVIWGARVCVRGGVVGLARLG